MKSELKYILEMYKTTKQKRYLLKYFQLKGWIK